MAVKTSDFPDRAPRPVRTSRRAAFTLIEMLAVMGILVILLVLVAPAANNIMRGSNLTQGGQNLNNLLGLARQQALSLNVPIEVRFYQYVDPAAAGEATPGRFRAVQLFKINEANAAVPLGKIERFPNTFMLDSGAALSPLLSDPRYARTPASTDPSLPDVGANYRLAALRFYPDGSTNLSQDGTVWFVTAHTTQFPDAQPAPPPNFYTLQIDPANGNIKEYRP